MLEHDDLLQKTEGDIIGEDADVYIFSSKSEEGRLHYVLVFQDEAICTCDGWRFTNGCWHIRATMRSRELSAASGTELEGVPDASGRPEHEEIHRVGRLHTR